MLQLLKDKKQSSKQRILKLIFGLSLPIFHVEDN